ncbi:putative RNA-directed DNA polymerase from transposon X-element [Stylophora pistillata]|uniref:Putative RNA-directed DNA polymerase from transposon X-element n=1 Tax=Stylophora pistillata TaxID=50429 RepID=A0A2B4RLB5_STYPI|nr:putative RNA-directed DNA polymerase from transposon X-element [Stylophora pistillata]
MRTVTTSSRDPMWMTPLVKSLLKQKSRISIGSADRVKALNKRISEIICENRGNFSAAIGTCDWWKRVDDISQCRRPGAVLSLDHDSLRELNNHFAELCSDDVYPAPTPLEIGEEVEIPTVSERAVWNTLQRIKKTATGPDAIPYTTWKDHAELVAPVCTAVRLYAMDFKKAFDSVKHDLLPVKLKQIGLSPYIANWYLSLLEGRMQRLLYDGFVGQWKDVNKGTTQGSVSGPHLFTIFLNDLEISLNGKDILFKYADDTSIVSPVWKEQDNSKDIVRAFMEWSEKNSPVH